MAGWENFFIAEVGASAALAGLIFVGVSLNLARILAQPRLPNRAFGALTILLAILIIASLSLVPQQSVSVIGGETLVAGILTWLLMVRLDWRIQKATEAQYKRISLLNVAMSQIATLPYLIGSIQLLGGSINGFYWFVPAVIFSFVKAVLDAWVLLVEINR